MTESDAFLESRYLNWYIPRLRRGGDPVNLHSSGVPPMPSMAAEHPAGPMDTGLTFETALAAWLDVPPEEVVYTTGATAGTLLALLALARPTSEVLVEEPIYEPMLRQPQRLNRVRRLRRRFEDGWRLPMGEARQVVGPETSMVMITEPHNPSGLFSPREDVLELAAIAARHGAVLLVNEVYRGFSDRPSYHGAADNLAVVSSFSKLLGTYWTRLGWLSALPPLARRIRAASLNLGPPSTASAAVGLRLLQEVDEARRHSVERARAPLAEVDEWVQRTPGVAWHRPQGPGYGCLRLPAGSDDVQFAERLHDEHNVLVVPGTLWEAPGTLRISWLCAGERLREGLDGLETHLERQAGST